MPQDIAASAGEIIAQAPAESVSTAVEPQTETQSTSTSLMDKLGIPAEVQAELESKKPKLEPTPAEEPAPAEEPEVPEPSETPSEENLEEEKPEARTNWTPEQQKEFEKRVGREVRKRRKAEEEREQIESERDQLRATLEGVHPVTVAPSSSDRLSNVQDESQLSQVVAEARQARDWCRKHQQGFTENEGTEKARFMPPEEISEALSQAEDVLMFEVPRKQAELRQRHQYDGLARTVHPTIFDRKTEDYQVATALLSQLPGLVNHPARNLILGDYIAGVKVRLSKGKANGNGKHPEIPAELTRKIPPLAPHVPSSTRSSNAVPPRKKIDQAMNNVAQDGGSREAITAAIREKRLARQKATDPRSPALV